MTYLKPKVTAVDTRKIFLILLVGIEEICTEWLVTLGVMAQQRPKPKVVYTQLTSSSSSLARRSVVPDGKMYKFIPVHFYICPLLAECFEKKIDTPV